MKITGKLRRLCTIVAFSCMAATAQAADRPNILLILADDMGYSDISPYGGEIFTPNIAAIAAQGIAFDNFHVAAYCAPTRAMVLTGQDNHVVGLGNMIEIAADNQRGRPGYEGSLNGRAPTIATTLQNAGYATFMAGKWHLGKTEATIPAAQGFANSVGVLEGGADNYENKSYTPSYKSVHFFEGRGALTLPADFYSSKYYADRSIGWIDEAAAAGRPFFGYLAFQAVHQPHQAPADFIARYRSTYTEGWAATAQTRLARMQGLGIVPPGVTLPARPAGVPDWASLPAEEKDANARRMAAYAGMLEYMDFSIGRIVDHLREKGMLDNTVIVFMSDNGGEAASLVPIFPDYYTSHFDMSVARIGEKGSYSEYGPGWARASGTPFSNFKGSAQEGGTRAPIIVRYPALAAGGRRSEAMAYVTDLVPTLLDIAGVAPGAPLSGRSMMAAIAGKSALVHPEDEPIGYEAAGGAAIYRGPYKLVRSAPPYGNGQWQVFDIVKDPTESHDLSAAQPDLARALQADYAAYVARNGVVEVPPDYNIIAQGKKNAAAQ